MTSFTRLTLVGQTRRAEVVVPSDEGFAALLPQLLDLVDEAPRLQPETTALVRATGEQVDLALDATTQQLADGEVLRVVRAAAAPPPPEVADVTDVASDALAARADRWDVDVRQRVAAVAVAVAVAAAGTVLVAAGQDLAAAVGAVAGALLAGATAAGVGRSGRVHGARSLTAAGLGAAPVVGLGVAGAGLLPALPSALAAAAVAWCVLAAGAGVGGRDRGTLAGALAGAGLTVVHLGLRLLVPPVAADAVVAVVAAVALGLLPGYAMTASGLTALDDAVLDGALPARRRVQRSLDDAYRGLTWSTVAVATTLATAATALLVSPDRGATTLGALVVAVAALRTRSLPLAVQGVVLWAAAGAPVVVAVLVAGPTQPWLTAGALLAAALAVAVVAAARPSGQQRARWRRTGDLVELFLVVALLPVLLGVLGVYGELLEVF